MASNGNRRIDWTIGFKYDKSGLSQITSDLNKIASMTTGDFMKIHPEVDVKEAERQLKELKKTAESLRTAFQRSLNLETGVVNIQKLNAEIKKMGPNIESIKKAGAAGEVAFNNMYKSALTTHNEVKKVQTVFDKLGVTFANTIKWGIASSAMNTFTGAAQQAYGYVKNLDTSLNDIRIVTGKSSEEMEKFAVHANDAAKALGKTTNDYTKAALIYYQQGLSDEEAKARTDVTLKAASVTGQSASQVSEQLTAVWNGYKVSAEETELYVDKLAKVAAATAADLEELSTGMSKVASAANVMGVDVDQLNAQLATIISVTREAPETIGTSLKTVYARMATIKAGGVDEEDGATLTSYTEKMSQLGIDVLDSNNKLRDMGDVIEEIGNKWNSMSKEQQVALAQTIAGTRQYSRMIALFDNWDQYQRTLQLSSDAMGTLQEQQDIYMDSISAHLNTLTAQWEDLYDSILDEGTIKTVLDGFTGILSVITKLVDALGGGGGLIALLGAVGGSLLSRNIGSSISAKVNEKLQAQAYEKTMQQRIAETTNGKANYVTVGQQKMTETTAQYARYYKYLSEDQIKAAENTVKLIGDLENERVVLEENNKTITKKIKLQKENIDNIKNEAAAAEATAKAEAAANQQALEAQKQQLEQQKLLQKNQLSNIRSSLRKTQEELTKSGTIQTEGLLSSDYNIYHNAVNTGKGYGFVSENEALKMLSTMDLSQVEAKLSSISEKANKAKIQFENLGTIFGKNGKQLKTETEIVDLFSEKLNKASAAGLIDAQQYKAQANALEVYKEKLLDSKTTEEEKQKIVAQLKKDYESLTVTIKNNAQAYEQSYQDVKKYNQTQKELDVQIKKIEKDIVESKNKLDELNKSYEAGGKKSEELKNKIKAEEEELKKLQKELKETTEAQKTNTERTAELAKRNQAIYAALSGMIGKVSESLVQGFSSLGNFAMGLSSLKSGFDALSNTDMSWSERISSFFMSMTIGLPMTISGISKLGKSISGIVGVLSHAKALGQELMVQEATGLKISTVRHTLDGIINKDLVYRHLLKKNLISDEIRLQVEEGKLTAAEAAQLVLTEALNKATSKQAFIEALLAGIKQNLNERIEKNIILQKLQITSLSQLLPVLGTITGVIIAIGVAIAAGVFAWKAYKKGLEETAKVSTQAAKESKAITEAKKEEKQQIDELVKSYKELQEQYGESNLEQLRQETYKLCKQYGQQDLAIKALTASYEELNQIMDETQTKAHTDYAEAINKEIGATTNSIKDNIWSNMKSSQRDTRGGQKTIDLKGQGYFKEFFFDYDNSADFREALERLGLDTDASGHINLDKFVEVAATNSEELLKVLESSTSAGATQLLEIYKEYEEDINRIAELNKEKLGEDAFSVVNPSTIDSFEKFNQAIEDLVKNETVLKNFGGDKEKAREWAEEWLGAIDSVSEYAQKYDLLKELNEQGVNTDGLSELEVNELTFLLKYKDLANTYNSPQDFLNKFKATLESQNRQGAILNIQLALNKDELTDEDISNLFADKTISQYIDMSEEEFKAYAAGGGQQRILEDALKQSFQDEAEYIKTNQSIEDRNKLLQEQANAQTAINNLAKEENEIKGKWNKLNQEYNNKFAEDKRAYEDYKQIVQGLPEGSYTFEQYMEKIAQAPQEDLDFIKEYQDKIQNYKQDLADINKSQEQQKNIIDEINQAEAERITRSKELAVSLQDITQLEKYYKAGLIEDTDYYANYQRLDREQDLEGLDAKELQDYRKYLQETAESSDELADSLTDDSEAAEIVAKSVMKMNKGIEALASNFEEWSDVLQKSEKGSQEYASALSGIRDAMSDLLDINEDYISENFLVNNLDKIQKAAEGDAEAIDELHKLLAEDIVMNLDINDDNLKNQLLSSIQDWQTILDNKNLEVGAEFNDSSMIAAMNELITDAGLTADQVNALFDSMGFEANFASQEQEIKYRTPVTRTEHKRIIQQTDKLGNPTHWIDSEEVISQKFVDTPGFATAFAMTTDGSTPQIKSLTKKATGSMNNASSKNSGGTTSSGSSGGSGSSSSSNQPSQEDPLEREKDIYREINEEIKDIESTLNRIKQVESHSWGASAQVALEKESKELDKLLEKYKKKAGMQEADLAGQRKSLANEGVTFSADGSVMTNAEDRLDQEYAKYNEMVARYNLMSAADQEAYKSKLDAQKEYIENLEKAMKDYESGFEDYQSTLDTILEKHYEQIELAVKQFNNKIKVELELDDAKKDWNDFWYDVVQDIDTDDFVGQFEKSFSRIKDIFGGLGSSASGVLDDILNHLNQTVDEVNKQIAGANVGGGDSLFGDDTALSKETLTEWRDTLIQYVKEAKQELENMMQAYLNLLDSAKEKIDEQIKGWEAIGSHLDHNIKLIKMISGEKAYDALNKQYELQYKNLLSNVETQRMSTEYWADQMKKYEDLMKTVDKGSKAYKTYSEAYKKASENYRDAVANLDKIVEEALEKLEEWKKNQLNEIEDKLNQGLTGTKLDLETVEEEWQLINKWADQYYDNVERSLAMEEYTKILNDAANATGLTAENQEKLNKFRDEELKKLQAKEKLTQYDIDESKARLAILQQEMALEDARQNKSKMRLRRDSQGNYTYQYTGDEETIDDAEGKLLTAKKEWYDLVKKRMKETTEYAMDLAKDNVRLWNEYQEALAAGDKDRADKLLELYNKNAAMIEQWGKEVDKNQKDMMTGLDLFFSNVQNNSMIPQFDNTARRMAERFATDPDSVKAVCEQAITDVQRVTEDFARKTEEVLNQAGEDYKKMVEQGIDPTTDALEDMVQTNEELGEELDEINSKLDEQGQILETVEENYNKLKEAATTAIQEANDALNTLADTAVTSVEKVKGAIDEAAVAARNLANIRDGNTNVSDSSDGDESGTPTGTDTKKGVYPRRFKVYTTTLGNGNLAVWHKQNKLGEVTPEESKDLYEWLKKKGLAERGYYYKSGGYTGTWAGADTLENGKLAFVHQKELILNQNDTSNLLRTIESLRTLVDKIDVDYFVQDLVKSISLPYQLLDGIVNELNSVTSYQNDNKLVEGGNVTINADFPNVVSADEIYDALINLETTGLQAAYANVGMFSKAY